MDRSRVGKLFHHFDDATRTRVDQNRAVVDDGVAIIPHAVFLRYIVIRHAGFRQYGPNPNVLVVAIRRIVALGHVAAKARTFVHSEDAVDTSDYTAEDAHRMGAINAVVPHAELEKVALEWGTIINQKSSGIR